MVRFQYVSDLHLEFLTDLECRSLAKRINHPENEHLILAGDICTHRTIPFLRTCLDAWSDYKSILFIPGNHEYYGYIDIESSITNLEGVYPNLRYINNKYLVIDGVHILGATLWFNMDLPDAKAYKHTINDFRTFGMEMVIRSNHNQAMQLLNTLDQLDLLITHHGVIDRHHPQFLGNPANVYYYTDLSPVLDRLRPQYVVHGHDHWNDDHEYGDTMIVKNCYGYNGKCKGWKPNKYITIDK